MNGASMAACCLLGFSTSVYRQRPMTTISRVSRTSTAVQLLEATLAADRLGSPEAEGSGSGSGSGITFGKLKPSRIRRGDYVIHQSYGVGRFEGLHQLHQKVQAPDGTWVPEKVLRVTFRDGDLDMPLDCRSEIKLYKRQEEIGELDDIKLDRLKSRKTWENRKERAAKNVIKVASDLLKMYAERQQLSRQPCPPDGEEMERFASQFTYQPTPDQLRCFKEVEHDMCYRTTPMDRLICGAHLPASPRKQRQRSQTIAHLGRNRRRTCAVCTSSLFLLSSAGQLHCFGFQNGCPCYIKTSLLA